MDYVYDLVGKIQQVVDPTGTYGFAYDNMGRLIGTTTQYSFLPGHNFQNSYTYDAASNRSSLIAPDGSTNSYHYDVLNRLTTLTNSLTGQFGFAYDALSRRTQLTRPNGINTNYSYDSVSHLLGVLHQAGSTTLDGASYGYDYAGNRTSKTNYLNGITSNYGYDLIYELQQVTQAGSTTESYSYDAVGNRLSSSGVPTYSYNSSNELTSNSLGSYTYDANGNTLSDPSGKSYSWDFENRLTQAVVPGTGTTTFHYDPFGRRIQKSGPLGTTNYLYDGINLLGELDASGTVLSRYTATKHIDEMLAESSSGGVGYYEADGLGTITSLSGPAGSLTDTYSYDSFGNITTSTGTTANPIRYMGRDFETELGLYNFRSRYYFPSTGRFLEEDTVRFQGGPNFYAFVRNDPVRYNDPLGEMGGDCQPWFFQNNGSPVWGSQTPIGGSKKPYNCMAWALGITNDWVQSITGYFPNEVPPQYGCKVVDCDDRTPNCKKKHRVNIYEDPGNYQNWHVERQNCDGSWSSKNGQSYLWVGINDPDLFYECQYHPKGPAKKTCWLCPGK